MRNCVIQLQNLIKLKPLLKVFLPRGMNDNFSPKYWYCNWLPGGRKRGSTWRQGIVLISFQILTNTIKEIVWQSEKEIQQLRLESEIQTASEEHLTLSLQDQICNSPYYQPCNSYNVISEDFVLNIIPKLIFFLILITYLVDIVLIL